MGKYFIRFMMLFFFLVFIIIMQFAMLLVLNDILHKTDYISQQVDEIGLKLDSTPPLCVVDGDFESDVYRHNEETRFKLQHLINLAEANNANRHHGGKLKAA